MAGDVVIMRGSIVLVFWRSPSGLWGNFAVWIADQARPAKVKAGTLVIGCILHHHYKVVARVAVFRESRHCGETTRISA